MSTAIGVVNGGIKTVVGEAKAKSGTKIGARVACNFSRGASRHPDQTTVYIFVTSNYREARGCSFGKIFL